MAYGIQKDNIPKPESPSIMDVGCLEISKCIEEENFSLYLVRYEKSIEQPKMLRFFEDAYLYLDEGDAYLEIIREGVSFDSKISSERCIKIFKNDAVKINFKTSSKIFLFISKNLLNKELFKEIESLKVNGNKKPNSLEPSQLFDTREKYWGKIQSIFSEEKMAGKIMYIDKGSCGSLEYHLNKYESYYLDKGNVAVGLRIGRAQNISVTVNEGHSFNMFPGLMHCRIGIEKCRIVEISTQDEDSDSYLVEDGNSYNHEVNI